MAWVWSITLLSSASPLPTNINLIASLIFMVFSYLMNHEFKVRVQTLTLSSFSDPATFLVNSRPNSGYNSKPNKPYQPKPANTPGFQPRYPNPNQTRSNTPILVGPNTLTLLLVLFIVSTHATTQISLNSLTPDRSAKCKSPMPNLCKV